MAASLWGEGGKGMGEISGLRNSLLKSFSIMSFSLCPGQRQSISWHTSLSPSVKLLDPSRIFPPTTLVSEWSSEEAGHLSTSRLTPSAQRSLTVRAFSIGLSSLLRSQTPTVTLLPEPRIHCPFFPSYQTILCSFAAEFS